MLVEHSSHPQFVSNTYLIADGEGGPAFFIDAGGPVEPLIAAADAQGVTQDVIEQQFLTNLRPTSLIKRFATTEEVANMVVYVCSEQASATTGAALRVDGGVVRYIA